MSNFINKAVNTAVKNKNSLQIIDLQGVSLLKGGPTRARTLDPLIHLPQLSPWGRTISPPYFEKIKT